MAPHGPFGFQPHRAAPVTSATWYHAWGEPQHVDGAPCARRGFAAQAVAASAAAAGGAGQQDPFTLVSDELDAVSARMRAAVVSEVRPAA